jgi:hypothetical protein
MGYELKHSVLCRACRVRRTVNRGAVCTKCSKDGKDPADYADASRPYRKAEVRVGRPRAEGPSPETVAKVAARYNFLIWHYKHRYDAAAKSNYSVKNRVAEEFGLTPNKVAWIMTVYRKKEREASRAATAAAKLAH